MKYIKQKIHERYNYSKTLLVERINKEIEFCRLIYDIWTAKNRKGYLGVTCNWIDQNFQLQEITLGLKLVEYLHNSENILITLIPACWLFLRRSKKYQGKR